MYNRPCHACNMISFPSADVISTDVVTCKYSLQSIRQRNSLSVGLEKIKYCIKSIFPRRCVYNRGNE